MGVVPPQTEPTDKHMEDFFKEVSFIKVNLPRMVLHLIVLATLTGLRSSASRGANEHIALWNSFK